MSSVNKVVIIGNLTKDPEVRQGGDREFVSFTVATSEHWKDKSTGERRERAEFHNVSVMNDGLANLTKSYLKKGMKVYLEGKLQTDKYTDKHGVERYTTKVVLGPFGSALTMLDTRKDEKDMARDTQAPLDDSIPF